MITTAVSVKKFTFAEYLNYNDGTDTRYELVNGELVAMSLGSGLHGAIIHFLEQTFNVEIANLNTDLIALKTLIGVCSPRGGRWDTSRIPDIVVIPLSQGQKLRNREAIIQLNEAPPLLVVEVVSESTKTVDYRAKRLEYNVLNIPEYWIVDPLSNKITIFNSVDEMYEPTEFVGTDMIISQIFPGLILTANQILTA